MRIDLQQWAVTFQRHEPPNPIATAISAAGAWGLFAVPRGGSLLDLEFHQKLDEMPQKLSNDGVVVENAVKGVTKAGVGVYGARGWDVESSEGGAGRRWLMIVDVI